MDKDRECKDKDKDLSARTEIKAFIMHIHKLFKEIDVVRILCIHFYSLLAVHRSA